MKQRLILCFIVLGLLFSLSTQAAVKSEKKFSMVEFIDLLVSVGVVNQDNIVKAKIFAQDYDKALTIATTSSAYIQLLNPEKSAVWEMDQDIAYDIEWGSQGLSEVRLALVGGKSKNCELVYYPVKSIRDDNLFKVLPKDGLCYDLKTATTSPILDGSYRLKIYSRDEYGVEVKDEASVKINPIPIPSLKVTYPNGKENLSRRETHIVKYSISNFTKSKGGLIYLSILDSNGNVVYNMHRTMRDNSIKLELPGSIPAGAYKIKLKLTTDEQDVVLEDESDNFFWLSTGY